MKRGMKRGDFNRKLAFLKDVADLVTTIIIIAGLSVAAIVAVGGVTYATKSNAKKSADCIANYSTFNNEVNIDNNCKDDDEEPVDSEDSETPVEEEKLPDGWIELGVQDPLMFYGYELYTIPERYFEYYTRLMELEMEQMNASSTEESNRIREDIYIILDEIDSDPELSIVSSEIWDRPLAFNSQRIADCEEMGNENPDYGYFNFDQYTNSYIGGVSDIFGMPRLENEEDRVLYGLCILQEKSEVH